MEQGTKKRRPHYGWLICTGVSVMQFGVVVLFVTVGSLFALPMSEALGCARSEWMLWMTFYAISYFISSPIWGNLLQNEKIPFRLLMTGGVLIEVVALLLFAFCNALWMAYLAGVLYGFAQVGIRSNLMPNIASNWFSGKVRGTALGIMNGANGIGGMIFPPIIAAIIASYGTTAGYLACAVFLCILCLPWTLFVLDRKPEDRGLAPVGYDPKATGGAYLRDKDHEGKGVSTSFAYRTLPFYLLMAATFLLAITGGIKNSMTGIAVEFLDGTQWAAQAAMISAFCLSVISASDLVSNLIIGPLMDRFGIYKPMIVFLCMEPIIYLSWIFFGDTPYGLFAGALFYGLHGCVLRDALPLIVRQLYGPKNFSKIFSRIYMWKGLMGGFSASIFAFFYDAAGSYVSGLVFGLATISISALFFFISIKIAKRNPFHWNEAAKSQGA